MDDLLKHRQEFDRIVNKYKLQDKDKAEEVAKFLTKGEKINAKEFATLFAMSEDEAVIFLSFIQKGIKFKEEHMDK